MKAMRGTLLLAAMLLSLGAAGLTCVAAPVQGDAGTHAIRARAQEWVDSYNRGDVPAVMDVLADDYLQDTQGQPGTLDKRALDRRFIEIFSRYESHVSCVLDQVYTIGDTAFDRGRYVVTYTPRRGGPTVTRQGRYMEVWGLQDGMWRVRYVTNIPEPDPAPVAAM